MNQQTVRTAIDEAREFIAAAEMLLIREKADGDRDRRTYPLSGSKESGRTRRASLDLTRALAEMRKP